jgi:pimeloyl-ACP methyl ester carboxylesterase
MSGLIVFIHGFRGDKEHWRYVPELLAQSLQSFNVVSMEWSAEFNSYADMTRSAEQILTRIKNEHKAEEPIFLIGYSMGGIIAREICLKLLESKEEEDRLWLGKVRAAITVGTPLCGLQRGIGLAAYAAAPFLTTKVDQVQNADFVFGRYAKGIKSAQERGVNGPKQIHIEIENDEICAAHDRTLYTDDDIPGGVIGATHRDFLPSKDHEVRLANLLNALIRGRHSSLKKPEKLLDATPGNRPDRLLLIACSNRKRSDGNDHYGGPGAASWIADVELRDRVLSKRTQVFSLLKEAKVDNGFERAENRLHQAPNRTLKRGPDLGGVEGSEAGALYLPAWQRYTGRLFCANKLRLLGLLLSQLSIEAIGPDNVGPLRSNRRRRMDTRV